MKQSIYRVLQIVAVLLLVALAAGRVLADRVPSYSLEELATQAAIVVIAKAGKAKEGELPTAYTVLEVLKGTGVKAGDTIAVNQLNSSVFNRLKSFWDPKEKPTSLVKGILYLKKPKGKVEAFDIAATGLWGVDTKGRVLAPIRWINDGQLYLTPLEGATEKQLLHAVRLGVDFKKTAAKLLAITDKKKRVAAILEMFQQTEFQWALQVPGSFWGGGKSRTPLMKCVWEDGTDEQCWELFKLRLRWTPELSRLATPAGRKFLVSKIKDKKELKTHRHRAGYLLREHLWVRDLRYFIGEYAASPSPKEQGELIEAFLPMVLAKGDLRLEALEIISRLSVSPSWMKPKRIDRRALPVVRKLLLTERDVEAYQYLADLFWELGGDQEWKAMTGAPKGPKVEITHDGISVFHAGLTPNSPPFVSARFPKAMDLTKPPTLRLVRLDDAGKVVETVKSSLVKAGKPRENDPFMEMSYYLKNDRDLAPGRWRLTLVGPDNAWVSLPRLMIIPKPPGR